MIGGSGIAFSSYNRISNFCHSSTIDLHSVVTQMNRKRLKEPIPYSEGGPRCGKRNRSRETSGTTYGHDFQYLMKWISERRDYNAIASAGGEATISALGTTTLPTWLSSPETNIGISSSNPYPRELIQATSILPVGSTVV